MKLTLSRATVVALVAFAILTLAPGASPAQASPSDNPYEGSWAGTFMLVGSSDPVVQGTVEWKISRAGQITGTFYNTTFGVPGTMVGHVDKDGTINLSPNIYGPGPGGEGGNGEHYVGQAYFDEDGHLVAPTTGTWKDAPTVIAVLAPV